MPQDVKKTFTQLTLAIHSTDNSFGFAYRKNKQDLPDNFFIKKFEKDLCNNLIADLNDFITNKNLKKINRISVSVGPANFNASRQIVVLARTLSQQINCPLDSFTSFELMAKRIALKNNIYEDKKNFWIFKKLKRKGYIAGKYEICISEDKKKSFTIKEKIVPKIFKQITIKDSFYPAEFKDREDLKELLNLSNKNSQSLIYNSWETVLPLYPISPIN